MRGGAGTALVGDPQTVAKRLREYQALGIETVIASGYPHLEEAYRVAELLFPVLGIAKAGKGAHRTAPGVRHRRRHGRSCRGCSILRPHMSDTSQALAAPVESDRVRPPGFEWRARFLQSNLTQWLVPASIVTVWQLASQLGLIPSNFLPAPSEVLVAGYRLTLSGELPTNIAVSFWRAASGFLIGGAHRLLRSASPTACRRLSRASSPIPRCRWSATSRIWR